MLELLLLTKARLPSGPTVTMCDVLPLVLYFFTMLRFTIDDQQLIRQLRGYEQSAPAVDVKTMRPADSPSGISPIFLLALTSMIEMVLPP